MSVAVNLVVALWLAAVTTAVATASRAAAASEGPEWVPFVGSHGNAVGCTYNNGCDGGYHGYPAIDFMIPAGTSVRAAGAGTARTFGGCAASSWGCNSGFGNYVRIDHPNGQSSVYAHLASISVTDNSPVSRGQQIGTVGNTGSSLGAHLHYEERNGPATSGRVDPGVMYAMHGSTKRDYPSALGAYSTWSQVPCGEQRSEERCRARHTVRNDSYAPALGDRDRDLDGDGKADLFLVAARGTGTGRPEAHVLSAASGYSQFTAQWATALGFLGGTDRLVTGDVDGDGKADLVLVATQHTGSGATEVHVLSAASGYSSFAGHCATALHHLTETHRVLMGDVNGDDKPDLIMVATQGTGSGRTEAHVLSGANCYSTFLANSATPLHYLGGTDRVAMGDVNGDGRDDLIYVATQSTGSGMTEAHVLDAATGYKTFLAHWVTSLGYLGPTDRIVAGDVNSDGKADLTLVATQNTGSGMTEAHVLDAATGYKTFLAHSVTALGYLGDAHRIVNDTTDPAPVANAGADQTVNSDTAFALDGSGSSDPMGGPVTYRWEVLDDVAVIIRDEDDISPTVDPVRGPRTVGFRLTITDANGLTATDEVIVTIKAPK